MLSSGLLVAGILFIMGSIGMVVQRKNLIAQLMCIEMILLAVNTNLVLFSKLHGQVSASVWVFYILAVAAAESAIGLAIIVLLYRHHKKIDMHSFSNLKG
ncbi:NADH-quinone oxidoreductase subunit NuoK [Gammaproteobacteria bacterium]|jgi:NADH-quinone oxidoreductase subunit K|nr:NADH-quinone oxidoreductase subunit NuoK [Gammaproteobacteria bacterium]